MPAWAGDEGLVSVGEVRLRTSSEPLASVTGSVSVTGSAGVTGSANSSAEVPATASRELPTPLTVLTYQALCTVLSED